MAETPDELAQRLRELIRPGARQRLVAKGLARGFIWRGGVIPPGAQEFDARLTPDLLDHAFGTLALALRLRETGLHLAVATDAIRMAAEALESVARRGDPADPERGFLVVVAAAAFHIARFSARAYCLLEGEVAALNLSSSERTLACLMRRDLVALREACRSWLQNESHQDAALAQRLADTDDDFDIDDLLVTGLTRDTHRSLALFEAALTSGDESIALRAVQLMSETVRNAGDARSIPIWWLATLALHLMDDLWSSSLHVCLPLLPPSDPNADSWLSARRSFLALLSTRGTAEVDLWPSQLPAAARAIDETDDLVVALPTSAGKTRIAELCILRALSAGKRVVYVTPLRALSAQLERTLGRTFRPLGYSVSSLYGASGVSAADVAALESDSIVVATPEKLDFAIRQDPSVIDDVALIVLDEGHMIGLGAREIRYEVLVQRLLARSDTSNRRIVCLSAIFSAGEPFNDFTAWLRSDTPGAAILQAWRPTRQRPGVLFRSAGNTARLALDIEGEKPFVPRFVQPVPKQGGRRTEFPNTANEMVIAAAKSLAADEQRVLIYCPQRRSVEPLAELCVTLRKQGVLPSLLKDASAIARAEFIGEEWLGRHHVAVQALRLGIAVHHGELPRPFLAEVERLLNNRTLSITIASPTVAQGLDLSCSALVLHSLFRGRAPLPSTEFANVIGRVGRAFVDLDGLTIYPVFETGSKATWKAKNFYKLWEEAKARTMESGIVLLIQALLNKLRGHVGGSDQQLLEYVLNVTATWEIPEVEAEDDTEGDFDELLANLDGAILATIERLDCDTNEVADLLDAALRSSLWRRRLQGQTASVQNLQRAVLVGRANWLWKRTQSSQRRGFFSAGIGFRAGDHINRHLDELLTGLVAAEEALAAGRSAEAAGYLTGVASRLFEIPPFALRSQDMPATWSNVIADWIGGVPLQQIVQTHGPQTVGFVQNGIVFHLVWGIEAVRVHANAVGDARVKLLSGILPLALTYGMPSIASNLLVQAGLPSRTMALSIISQLGADYTTMRELNTWLRAASQVDVAALWPTPMEQEIWRTFVSRWSGRTDGAWQWSQSSHDVTWYTAPPEPGAFVRVEHDTLTKRTYISTADYTLLGQLKKAIPSGAGYLTSKVAENSEAIVLERFGGRDVEA